MSLSPRVTRNIYFSSSCATLSETIRPEGRGYFCFFQPLLSFDFNRWLKTHPRHGCLLSLNVPHSNSKQNDVDVICNWNRVKGIKRLLSVALRNVTSSGTLQCWMLDKHRPQSGSFVCFMYLDFSTCGGYGVVGMLRTGWLWWKQRRAHDAGCWFSNP